MNRKFLQYLACPECKADLIDTGTNVGEDIIQGWLKCKNGHSFESIKGIPRFVKSSGEDVEQTKKSFGDKWKLVNRYGFDKVTKDFHMKWFNERFGFANESGLKEYLKGRSFILDVGCGTGRLSNMLAELTNHLIFAIDISESVDVAAENLKDKENVCVIQADLNKLPFNEKFFSLIICDMVIHHTPNPEAAFKTLAKHLRKNGEFFTYVYKVKGFAREYVDTALRSFTTNMSFDKCYKFAEAVTQFGKALFEIAPEMQRFVYWKILKCFWNVEHGWDYSVITNFDWYHPRFAFRYRPEDIQRWIDEAGLEARVFYMGDSGISVVVKDATN